MTTTSDTRTLQRALRAVLGASLLGIALVYLFRSTPIEQLVRQGIDTGLSITLIAGASIIIRGIQAYLILHSSLPSLRLMEAVALAELTTLINLVAPFQAGAAFRAYYLKRQRGLPLTSFAGAFAVASILRASVNGVFLGLAFAFDLGIGQAGPVAVGASILIACGFTYLASGFLYKALAAAVRWVRRPETAHLPIMRLSRSCLIGALLLEAMTVSLIVEAIWLLTRLESGAPDLVDVSLLAALLGIMGIVNIVPGNLGILEWMAGLMARLQGAEIATGISMVLFLRICNAVAAIVLLPIALWSLSRVRSRVPTDAPGRSGGR